MNLKKHHRNSKIIFWVAQVIGSVIIISLILFIGGNLIGELIDHKINFKEDYTVFILFLCEVCIAATIIISWYKRKMGAILVISFTILACLVWGRLDLNIILIHLPLLFSGLLLLLYAYYKEWLLSMEMTSKEFRVFKKSGLVVQLSAASLIVLRVVTM